jgi:3-hydroxybutyryl-CoA dehydrogenase
MTSKSPIRTVGVVGCGIMGAGIAQICVTHGFDTVVVEADQKRLDQGITQIRGRLGRDVERGRLSQEGHDRALRRLHGSDNFGDLADCDLVLEAIVEDIAVKRPLFEKLGRSVRPDAILASNTSSLAVSELAGASGRPDRVLGLHFFNPPTALRLLEVIVPSSASEETVAAAMEFCDSIDRVTVRVQDTPGFIVNRLLVPFIYDAIRMVEAGVATAEDIDQGCRMGLNHTMGPLATADLVGLDTLAAIGDAMFESYGEPRFKPPTILRRMISLGNLGRKSGQGFFDYARQDG